MAAGIKLPRWTSKYPALRVALPIQWSIARTDAAQAALQRVVDGAAKGSRPPVAYQALLPTECSAERQRRVAILLGRAACVVDFPFAHFQARAKQAREDADALRDIASHWADPPASLLHAIADTAQRAAAFDALPPAPRVQRRRPRDAKERNDKASLEQERQACAGALWLEEPTVRWFAGPRHAVVAELLNLAFGRSDVTPDRVRDWVGRKARSGK